MAIIVTRKGTTVSAWATDGVAKRTYDTFYLLKAVALENKLSSDPAFAEWWLFSGQEWAPKHEPAEL